MQYQASTPDKEGNKPGRHAKARKYEGVRILIAGLLRVLGMDVKRVVIIDPIKHYKRYNKGKERPSKRGGKNYVSTKVLVRKSS